MLSLQHIRPGPERKRNANEMEKAHTSIPHLLPKLLAMLIELALPSSTAALRHIHRRVAVAASAAASHLCWRLWRGHHAHCTLLIDDLHVASRENALLSRPFILSFGPIGIHELGDADAIFGQQGQVARVGGRVFV